MDNYFKLLDIAPKVNIDLENLSDQHKKLAAQHHPDNQDNEEKDDTKYKLINLAFKTLKSPAKRLMHLMEISNISYDKRGTVSDHLLDHFMFTAQLLQDTDAFLRKKSTTTSALALALLEGESQLIQEQLGKQIETIELEQTQSLQLAIEAEKNNQSLENSARDLAFLEKWQAQLKERYASLF